MKSLTQIDRALYRKMARNIWKRVIGCVFTGLLGAYAVYYGGAAIANKLFKDTDERIVVSITKELLK